MIVIKSPLRISLFGGGTDIPEYYKEHGSTIISFALDKAIYLIHNPRPTGGYRVSYSRVEELDTLAKSNHTLIRAAEHKFNRLTPPCTLSVISDVPKGTGLGSSSALAVALVYFYLSSIPPRDLAKIPYELERKVSPVGFQDHLPAAFGGLKTYEMSPTGELEIHEGTPQLKFTIQNYGMLLYTKIDREANGILDKMKRKPPLNELQEIHHIAKRVSHLLKHLNWATPVALANELTKSWQYKRNISGVSSAKLDNQFTTALRAGALGGKLCGAGGGGCWFLIVPIDKRGDVVEATGLVEIPFTIGDRISEVAI